MEHRIICHCAKNNASFNFRDEIMPSEIVKGLYCPECSVDVSFDSNSMLRDNGWIVEYEMDIAELYGPKLPSQDRSRNTPEMLFDEGYVTWRGVYPGDHVDSATERAELIELSRINPPKYVEAMKEWSVNRMERLKKEGWRKAYEREAVQ
jgi:hypothetical protein